MRDYQGFINHHLWSVSDGKPVQVLVQKKKGGHVPIEVGGYFRAHGTVSFSQGSKDPKTAFRLNVNDFTDLVPMPPPPFWQGPA
jgi:hypothetical protein